VEHSLVLWDWLAIGAYLALALGVGIAMTKRASGSTQDFFLAGRKLTWWLAGTSLVATSFAADTPLVVTGWVRSVGISFNWIWWGAAVGHALVAIVIAGWWRRAEVMTDAELIELRYAGRPAQALRGFYGSYHALVTNTLVLGWVLTAMVKISRVVLGLKDPQYDWLIVAGSLAVALTYSVMSGLWGVVLTDFFQFWIAVGGAVLLAWRAMDEVGGLDGWRAAAAALPETTTEFVPSIARDAATGASRVWTDLGYWTSGFGAFLIFAGVQGWLNKNADGGAYAMQRFAASRNENHARGTMLWFSIAHYCIRPWPWVVVAISSLVLINTGDLPLKANGLPDHETAYPIMMRDFLGPGLFGLMCASFLAAFMSTVDTHFNTASAYVVNDVYRRFLKPKASEKHYVRVGRLSEVLVGVIGGLIALRVSSISDLYQFSLNLLGGLGPAIILRWFWWRANAWTEISALATSTSMALMMQKNLLFGANPPLEIPYPLSNAVVVGTSALVCLTVTLLTAPPDRAAVQIFYDRIRPSGAWGPFRRGDERNRALPLLLGWVGGAALIFGLLFGVGSWLFGHESWGCWLAAAAGGVALYWAWPRALHPVTPIRGA
jgi:Na+/proline symporter